MWMRGARGLLPRRARGIERAGRAKGRMNAKTRAAWLRSRGRVAGTNSLLALTIVAGVRLNTARQGRNRDARQKQIPHPHSRKSGGTGFGMTVVAFPQRRWDWVSSASGYIRDARREIRRAARRNQRFVVQGAARADGNARSRYGIRNKLSLPEILRAGMFPFLIYPFRFDIKIGSLESGGPAVPSTSLEESIDRSSGFNESLWRGHRG